MKFKTHPYNLNLMRIKDLSPLVLLIYKFVVWLTGSKFICLPVWSRGGCLEVCRLISLRIAHSASSWNFEFYSSCPGFLESFLACVLSSSSLVPLAILSKFSLDDYSNSSKSFLLRFSLYLMHRSLKILNSLMHLAMPQQIVFCFAA